jgi:hypothetical protein
MNLESTPTTAGIVCDNYKLYKFETELNKQGFVNYTLSPFTKETTTIKVKTTNGRITELKKLCELVEFHFKRGN